MPDDEDLNPALPLKRSGMAFKKVWEYEKVHRFQGANSIYLEGNSARFAKQGIWRPAMSWRVFSAKGGPSVVKPSRILKAASGCLPTRNWCSFSKSLARNCLTWNKRPTTPPSQSRRPNDASPKRIPGVLTSIKGEVSIRNARGMGFLLSEFAAAFSQIRRPDPRPPKDDGLWQDRHAFHGSGQRFHANLVKK